MDSFCKMLTMSGIVIYGKEFRDLDHKLNKTELIEHWAVGTNGGRVGNWKLKLKFNLNVTILGKL